MPRTPPPLRTGAPGPPAAGHAPAPGRQGVFPRATAPPLPQGTDTSAGPALADARPGESLGVQEAQHGTASGGVGEHLDGPLPSRVALVHQKALARLAETREALNALIKAQPKAGSLLGGTLGVPALSSEKELKPTEGAQRAGHTGGVGTEGVGTEEEVGQASGVHLLGHRIRTPSVHRVPSVKDISVSASLFAAATGVAAKQSVQVKPKKKGEGETGDKAGSEKRPKKGPAAPSWRHSEGNPFLHGNFEPVRTETVMPIKCEVSGQHKCGEFQHTLKLGCSHCSAASADILPSESSPCLGTPAWELIE